MNLEATKDQLSSGESPTFNTSYIKNPSPTLEMNQLMNKLEKQRKEICRLGFGGSPLPIPDILGEALKLNAGESAYPDIQGLASTRVAIADFYQNLYQFRFSPDQIMIYPGSKEAIFQILTILDGPVLIPKASWVSYEPQANMAGKEVIWIQSDVSCNWKLTASNLERGLPKKSTNLQKILVLNSPSNPAGQTYTPDELKSIADICRKNRIFVIFDGIYGTPYDFNDLRYSSLSQFYPEGTIFTGGLSKIFSAGGWRFGFAILPDSIQWETFRKALVFRQSESLSGVCHPVQLAATALYKNLPDCQSYFKTYHHIFKTLTRYMHDRLCKMRALCHPATGGYYLFPEFSAFLKIFNQNNIFSSKDLANQLIQLGVCTLPGECFGVSGDRFTLRIACVDINGPEVFSYVKKLPLTDKSNINPDHLLEFAPRLIRACDLIETFLKNLKKR